MPHVRHIASLAGLVLLIAGVALAQDAYPPEARKRFEEAVELTRHNQHLKAAELFRSVAEWPGGGNFKERAWALYNVGTELKLAGELEQAAATWRELVARFPRSDFAGLAEREANKLASPAEIDFERRFAEVSSVSLTAITRQERRQFDEAQPLLVQALGLLESLLHDHRDLPKACDVACQKAEVLKGLGRYSEAVGAANDAIELAEREARKPGAPNTARGGVVSAERELAEVKRALWCYLLDLGSKIFLGLLAAFLVAGRPWRLFTARLVKLTIGLLLADLVFGGLAIAGAEYAQRRDPTPDALMTDDKAFLLAIVPGAVGILVALGTAVAYKRYRGLPAVVLALLAALATSVCLVQHYGFTYAFFSGI
jgi:tetratricopeptide (TPR) repeat protein